MEITIHTGCAGDCNKININWFDENGAVQSNVLEVDVLNFDKPRTLYIKLDGRRLATIPEAPRDWCKHISASLSGKYCYNGMDISQWTHCPKCGMPKPSFTAFRCPPATLPRSTDKNAA